MGKLLFAVLAVIVTASLLLGCGGGATTTAPPVTTTAPPVTTTAPPVTTTAPPAGKLGPTQEVDRTFFGYNVEGLDPVSLIYCSDSPFGTTGDVFALMFETMVEKESTDKAGVVHIDVKHYRSGSLYNGVQIVTQIPLGTVDMGSINTGYLQTKTPEFCPWAIAYTWKSPEQLYSVTCSREWYKSQLDLYTRDWNEIPLHHAPYGNWDYWSSTAMHTINDFKGKTFWSYGELANNYLASWGATGVILARAEEYMAYYRGALDGISGSVVVYQDYKYYECGKYWLHMPTYPPGSTGFHYVQFVINAKKWATLPEAYKRIIIDAADIVWSAMIWEMLCEERAAEWKLVHLYGMYDMGIATNTPEEYQKICDAAVAAGKNYTINKMKVPEATWNEVRAFVDAKGDPKITADYTWWYTACWAEADRRVNEAFADIKAGTPQDQAFDKVHPKRYYDMLGANDADKVTNENYQKVKAALIATPRPVNDWPLEWKLAGKSQ
jgi:TRAP-type C4-dicarboxylate transport system substrate-binding protein